jgi:hypothetical protein
MDLATHQRKLLRLLRDTTDGATDDDPYVRAVACSRDLEEARRNVFLWRIYVLERTCILTFRLLRQKKLLGATVASFIATRNISPFRETQPPAFLETLRDHADPLVASVAQFELALMNVRRGDRATYTIHWNREPAAVLDALATDRPVGEPGNEASHEIVVSSELPSLFRLS